MKDKPITVEDYEKYGKEFFDKYFWIAKELGDNARAEDILKIMESLGSVVIKKRSEEEGKIGPFGFIRELNDDGAPVIDSPDDAPAGTVAIKTNGQWAAYEL
jgi:hypothetical protein|tara:strand:- start:429 stop:734 length:306 start_codon:yes stop_codon:yes gene_type:complete